MSRIRLIVVATVSVGVFAFVVIYLAKPSFAESSRVGFQSVQFSQELQINSCSTLVGVIDQRVNYFKTNQDQNILNYRMIDFKIQKLIDSKLSQNIDTEKLNTNLETYRNMVFNFKQKYLVFISILEEAKTLSCTDNKDLFENKVNQATDVLLELRNIAEEIKLFLSTINIPE